MLVLTALGENLSQVTVECGEDVVMLRVGDLPVGAVFREGGIREDQVERLVKLRAHWPPILVGRITGHIVDGVHRIAAARALGMEHIEAAYFEGTADDELIEFVRRNVHHGLTLTLRERRRAARQVLIAHPQWSDRRIAELCAISPKTAGRLRTVSEGPAAENAHLDSNSRIGRDNKLHPVDTSTVRTRVVKAIEQEPDGSLRTIAALAGVSPETVRSVRTNMSKTAAVKSETELTEPVFPMRASEPSLEWGQDRALVAKAEGEKLIAWLERTAVEEKDWQPLLGAVPISRVYEIADEARRRSEQWSRFARCVEDRARGPR